MIACANGNVHPLLLSGVLLALILPLRHQFCATLHAVFGRRMHHWAFAYMLLPCYITAHVHLDCLHVAAGKHG